MVYHFLAGTTFVAVVLIDNYGVLDRPKKDVLECDPPDIASANLYEHVNLGRKCHKTVKLKM